MEDPIHVISLGAGVQSSTMALMAAHGDITPMPTAAIFADTQAEHHSVYDYLEYLEPLLPFPIIRASQGSLMEDSLKVRTSATTGQAYMKPALPVFILRKDGSKGMMGRQCTLDYKVKVVRREIRKLIGFKRSARAVVWIGISTDEADRQKPSTVSHLVNRHPLIDAGVSRKQCLAWLKTHRYEHPPKSACVFCPYHGNDFWRHLEDYDPKGLAQAVQFERDYQAAMAQCKRLDGVPFLHSDRIPLDQVDFSVDKTAGFTNECEGMCGV